MCGALNSGNSLATQSNDTGDSSAYQSWNERIAEPRRRLAAFAISLTSANAVIHEASGNSTRAHSSRRGDGQWFHDARVTLARFRVLVEANSVGQNCR